MKIATIESLHADAGQRNFDFLKTPVIEDGYLRLPAGPGWGTDVNEEAVRAHPPKKC